MAGSTEFKLSYIFKGLGLFLLLTALAIGLVEINFSFMDNIPRPVTLIAAFSVFIIAVSKLIEPFGVSVYG